MDKRTQEHASKKEVLGEELAGEWRDLDDALPESMRRRLETFVPELVKKTFAAGLGAVFTTEDSIRKISKEIPMPKEVAGYLASTASTTKDEFMRILARETREFLQNVNLSSEVAKLLSMLSVEVKAEINFKEKKNDDESGIKGSLAFNSRDSQEDESKRRRRHSTAKE